MTYSYPLLAVGFPLPPVCRWPSPSEHAASCAPAIAHQKREKTRQPPAADRWKLSLTVLYFHSVEGLRGIRHSNRTQSRLTGTGRQPRARRRSSNKSVTAVRRDLTRRLRPLQAALKRRLARADVLADMIRAVNASLEPERVAEALVARVSSWLPVPGWLVLADDGGGQTRQLAAEGLEPPFESAARAIGTWVMRNGEVYCAANVAADRRIANGAAAAALGFPLSCRGRTMGALVGIDRVAASAAPRLLAPTLSAVLAGIEPGAIALENALRVQRAEALSVTDDLTQLYNSRYLSQVLRRETKRATRSGRPLSLLFVDLDGFKSINDTHGHLFGSRALVEAASVIRASARETDMVARFGGDEFALILPDTGSEGAAAVGDRVRDRIAAFSFLRGDGLSIRLTVSVGVATLPDVASTADGLIQAADEAMYWVKDHGKNGIHIAGT
jgi:diguanylate cyclase (GGDEF)-like protein